MLLALDISLYLQRFAHLLDGLGRFEGCLPVVNAHYSM